MVIEMTEESLGAKPTAPHGQRLSQFPRRASVSLHMLGARRSLGGSMARAYKLAQYFRVIPCSYPEQAYCFAACLLKWFRLEAMRQEAYAASMTKSHHPDRHGAGSAPPNIEGELSAPPPLPPPPADTTQPGADEEEGINGNEEQAFTGEREGHNAVTADDAQQPETVGGEEKPKEGGTDNQGLEANDEAKAEQIEGEQEAGSRENSEQDGGSSEEIAPERPIYGAINKPPIAKIQYQNSREKRDTLRLAFSAMKYLSIIEKLLDEITFYSDYPDLKEEEQLVLVLVYDYAMRNFQRRTPLQYDRQLPTMEKYYEYMPNNRLILYPPGGELFKTAEQAVQAMCMRLAAAVARVRVRNQVGSLRLLLPQEWRKSEALAEGMSAYGWYNQLLGKQDIVTGWLKDHGFRRIIAGRLPQPMEYGSDKHCSDVFVFNKADLSTLLDSEVVLQRNLVLQDKSSCLGVHCLLANVQGGEEVLFANCINVYSAVHMEGLIGNKFPLIQPVPQIRCIRNLKEDEDIRLTTKMGSKVIKATSEEFLSMEFHGEKNKSIRHIFIEASDTRSSVIDPVGFLEVENDDVNILRDMWTPPGHPSKEARKVDFINKTAAMLRHALKFSGVRTVTLLSHSEDPDETDVMVARVIDITNRALLKEAESIAASSRGATTGTAFNPQVPVFPGLQEEREALEAGKPTIIMKNNSIRVPASREANGFYLVILNKEQILLKSPDEMRQESDGTARTRDKGGRARSRKR
ncbi:unnamed protein product [Calicophoron daubneyi]|uniref:Methyltransferase NSUN7 n=1 Tax=Calicophoron daubneyi TaxID=300641 RepID=A0AAV2TE24_CALDB